MQIIDRKIPITLNPARERYEAVCPGCEQVVFFVWQKSIRDTGRPLPRTVPHLCHRETDAT